MDPNLQLHGRRVVVTGAASGIGRATANALATAGATLALLDLDSSLLRSLAIEAFPVESTPLTFAVDVSQENQVDDAFQEITEKWSGIDVVINVAGIMREQKADIRNISLDSWSKVVAVNLTGTFLVARAACRVMIPQETGTLILVGSPAGVTTGSGSIPYGASKGGVNGLSITLERHLEGHGIRVHNFCPGSVATPLYTNSLAEGVINGGDADTATSAMEQAVSPEGVGQAIALLASPLAGYLKGTIFSR